MLAGVATGVSSAADEATLSDISTGRAETSSVGGRRQGDRDHDEHRRRVADQLAEHGGHHEEPDEQRVRPGVADDVDQPVGELARRRRSSVMAVDSGIMPATSTTVVHDTER